MNSATRKRLEKLVDEAGELQQAQKKALNAYNAVRKKLYARIMKTVGPDERVMGKKSEAIVSYDYHDQVSINEFLEHVTNAADRNTYLRVNLTEARKAKSNVSEVLKEIVKNVKDDEPTLHVSGIKAKKTAKV